jgi:ABC-2 type transport system ATP-binding protein
MGTRAIEESAAREGSSAQPVGVLEQPPRREPREAPDGRPTSLSLKGISKRWRRQHAPVLDGVDFELRAGECVWIGGRNGAGKTTLLRIAAGLITPDRGRIRLRGLDPERDRRRYQASIGFLSAGNVGLTARLTARYQLQYWARLAFVPGSEQGPAIERMLTRFSLREIASSRVDRLSMGQRQRLRAAMVFLPAPDVVLLDEPLTSLDDEGAAMLAGAVREVLARGGSVVSCSPSRADQPELDFDHRYLMEAGRLTPA